ncbi:MAG: transporter, family, multidrug resistance protein [Pseudonocardiales bacterium]|nr:transporter, family, multidrug resistance protein [Pseudonocardiales bacterium]
MTAATASPSPLRRLWQRELPEYPTGARRIWHLGIVFAATVVAYYENFISGAVTTQLLGSFHISFLYFAVVTAVANAIGAIGSLASGVADKVGRGNMAIVGLFGVSLVTLLWLPNVTTGLQYGIAFGAAGIFEGIILVVTPALVRDFSPQVGRAQAMAFWTMGPVLGSLLVTEVSSHTLDSHPHWQFQFEVAGWAGLVVCVLALLCLRELNGADRDRIVGALEAETGAALSSRRLLHEADTRRPYRQMFRLDIVGPAVGISVFLLMYYTAIGVLPVYFQTNLNFSASQSNSLLNWMWATTALSMLVFGVLSDKLRIRKPLILAGALASVAVDIAFLSKAGSGFPTFSSIAILLALTGAWLGAAYAPWMAAFTETVEHRNPALSATGLAIWGWILRVTVAGAVIAIPLIVSAVTPLVDDGPSVLQAQAYFDKSKPLQLLLAEAQAHPKVFSDLAASPNDPAVQKNAIETIGAPTLITLAGDKTAQRNLVLLTAKAPAVLKAQADSPGQWRTWFWICTVGALALCPLSLLLRGPWRPHPTDDAHAVEHALELANRSAYPDAHPVGPAPLHLPEDVVPAQAAVRQQPEAGTWG